MLRRIVLGAVVVAAVIVGLLAMHTLNLHGNSATHGSTTGSVVSPDVGHETTAIDAGTQHLSDCEGRLAEEGHTAAAAACVLVLIMLLTLLLTPRYLGNWLPTSPRPGPAQRILHVVQPRPPSLEVLCISRI